MPEFVRTINLGNARITIINIGDIYLPLAGCMNLSESELVTLSDLQELANQKHIPIQFIHIWLPKTSVLVDAGVYDIPPDSEYAIPGYEPPPGLLDRLVELEIHPSKIEHVIITHRHWDHFNGTTIEENGQYAPCFPNARYYLGRADWRNGERHWMIPSQLITARLEYYTG